MTRPGSRPARPAAVPASIAGAVDLSGLKARPAPATAASSAPAPQARGLTLVVEVTEATFEAEVLLRSNQVPVIVDLGSARSPQSVELTATLGRMAAAAGGEWILATVDVDTNPRIVQAFGVQAIPTVIAVAGGQPLADFQGSQTEEQLREWLAAIAQAVEGKLSGPPAGEAPEPEAEPEDPRFTVAEEALDQGDLAGAEAAFQAIVDAEPTNIDALGAVRQVRFLIRLEGLEPGVVDASDADPADVATRMQAADALLSQQQPEAAFGRLIDGIKRSAGDDKTALRTRLLELFELFDPADPLVVAARRKLASALY